MEEKDSQSRKRDSFLGFLSSYRIPILIILLLAITFRIVLAVQFPLSGGDEIRYTVPAVNMLAGHGFTSDLSAPYRPTDHTVPLYPLLIAGVYGVFGQRPLAVRIAQGLIDLLTGLLVAFITLNLAPARFKRLAAILSLAIYECLSWFTVHWTRYLLTETLAIFMTVLAISLGIVALRRGRWFWLLAGASCGLALLTRADSVLLVFAFLLLFILQIMQRRWSVIVNALVFCLAMTAVLVPWGLRNYVSLRKIQPLASEYGFPGGEYMPKGYLWWLRTWMTDETYFTAFDPAFHPGSHSFDPHELPDSVFDSVQEKEEVFQLLARYDQTGQFTGQMSDEFRVIGNGRIKRSPSRFFLWLPLRRIASVWLTSFATQNPLNRFLRILFVLPILIGGVIGFAFSIRKSTVAQLLLFVILIRTMFLAFHYAPEARYIVEAYPAMIASCGVTAAALWHYLNDRRTERRHIKTALSS